MSLLSLPDEILLKHIFSCDNITTTDLFRLMITCSRLRDIIHGYNQLWMLKCSARRTVTNNNVHGRKNFEVFWRDWVFKERVVREVKKVVPLLSKECYPFGKLPVPFHALEDWIAVYPNIVFDEYDLHDMIWNQDIIGNLTESYYAGIVLKRLATCLQVKKLKDFMAKSAGSQTILEGSKLISKWFHVHANGWDGSQKLIDSVEKSLNQIAERVLELVRASRSELLEDQLAYLNEVLFVEMGFRVYKQDEPDAYNHMAASIHKVLEERVGYPEMLCVIYQEVATRMGIMCKPICLKCDSCKKSSILKCRVEGSTDVFHIRICSEARLLEKQPVVNGLLEPKDWSFENLIGQMLKSVVDRDVKLIEDRRKEKLRSSVRLACVLWPAKENFIGFARLCLEVDDGVEDAYRLLQLAGVDKVHQVMTRCGEKLNSLKRQRNEAKVARHRVPSIRYAVGMVVLYRYEVSQGLRHEMRCVILSWDECFQKEESRRNYGLSFESVTNGFVLDQPFFHIVSYRHQSTKFFYVPQECLELLPAGIQHNRDRPKIAGLGIFFKLFDGRNFVPNAEHQARFPGDNASAISVI